MAAAIAAVARVPGPARARAATVAVPVTAMVEIIERGLNSNTFNFKIKT